MKTFIKLSFIFCLLFIIQSCDKDEFTQEKNEGKIIQTNFNVGTGIKLLSKKDYEALPRLDLTQLKALPGFETELRSTSRYLLTPPVSNQGSEGSCTAFSIGYCAMSYYKAITRPGGNFQGWYSSNDLISPEHLYNNSKWHTSCDSGAYATWVLDFARNTGVASWELMPYSSTNGCSQKYPSGYEPIRKSTTKTVFNPKLGKYTTVTETTYTYPPFDKYKIPSWRTVWAAWPFWIGNVIKDVINSGRPVIGGFEVDQNFMDQTSISPYDYTSKGGERKGGHAVVIMGYDDQTQRFKVQNSWGTSRHDKGFFYVSYSNIGIFSELYTFD